MIVKKISSKGKTSKSVRIRGLSNYIVNPSDNEQEKCTYSNTLNFETDEFETQQLEMIGLAGANVRTKNPIDHWVMSWKDGEYPTNEQVDEAVKMLVKELGYENCQTLYGLHQDTTNCHVHVMLNRLDIETEKLKSNSMDIEKAHKAISKIEKLQGWKREENGRYEVQESGLTVKSSRTKEAHSIPNKQRQMESHTGEESVLRHCQNLAKPIIQKATTWEQLHEEFSKVGITYTKKGSGALITALEVSNKASQVDKAAGLSQLEKRLGAYVSANEAQLEQAKVNKPILMESKPETADWRKEFQEKKKYAKEGLIKKHKEEVLRLKESQLKERGDLLKGSWNGKGVELNIIRMSIKNKQLAELKELKEKQKKEKELLVKSQQKTKTLQRWLDEFEEDKISGKVTNNYDKSIANFTAIVNNDRKLITYISKTDKEIKFIDHGNRIVVKDRSTETLDSALKIASEKYGGRVDLSGSMEFKEQAARAATRLGIVVNNKELAGIVQQERVKMESLRVGTIKPKEILMPSKRGRERDFGR
jgi:hypothetical protein